jgi:hypothetical protein
MIDIRNCKLEYRCNQRWEQLDPVPGAITMRFCTRCQSAVHRADSEAAFAELARQGKCVAVFGTAAGKENRMIGRPEGEPYGH